MLLSPDCQGGVGAAFFHSFRGGGLTDNFFRTLLKCHEMACNPPRDIPETPKVENSMSENKFPAGWDEERVRRVLAHFEGQTEDDAVVEDEAGVEPSETVMNVPRDLVPKVRELIAKRHT